MFQRKPFEITVYDFQIRTGRNGLNYLLLVFTSPSLQYDDKCLVILNYAQCEKLYQYIVEKSNGTECKVNIGYNEQRNEYYIEQQKNNSSQ